MEALTIIPVAKGRRDEMTDKTPGAQDPEIVEKVSGFIIDR